MGLSFIVKLLGRISPVKSVKGSIFNKNFIYKQKKEPDVEGLDVKNNSDTEKKYIALISLINESEKRLNLSELVFLLFNLVVALFSINYISSFTSRADHIISAGNAFTILVCVSLGIAISTYWVAFAMRLQMKLKLRYFQARYMERKMNCIGEFIFADEGLYFDPSVRKLESPDNKETLDYPTSGLLRMDGFMGNAKPRHLSLFMPVIFYIIYLTIAVDVIVKAFY